MTEGLTQNQIIAAQPNLNVWVEASAGTGKTHVLTARVLRMMVQGTPPDHILGLTYTKAAAAEMADRIYKTLGKWAMVRDDELKTEILKTTGENADQKTLECARTLFALVLDIPGGLKIQTIHSFCQSLLKRFPLEAGLPPHFSVMDDRTAAEYLKEALDQVMLAATEDKNAALKDAFDHIANRQAEGTFESLAQAFLGKRRKILRLLQIYSGLEGLISATYGALGVDQSVTRESLIEDAIKDPAFDQRGIKNLYEFAIVRSPQEQKVARHMANFFTDLDNQGLHFNEYCKTFFKLDGGKRIKFFVKNTLEKYPDLMDKFKAEQDRLAEFRDKLYLHEVAKDTTALIRLGCAVLDHYQTAKAVHGQLDYDDLILNTSGLLAKEGITPWILYKLDGNIDHILVDEAQDTNQIQWQLVEALSDEFFSGVGARGDVLRTVFAVGDLKQSIYRFQGAEPKAFLEAKVRLAKKVKEAEQVLENCVLNTSYRSTPSILKAVDATFANPDAKSGIVQGDEVIEHNPYRLGHHGLVEVWPPERPDEKEALPAGWQLPKEQKFSHSANAKLAEKIARHIQEMINRKEELQSRGRPVRYGDILVLVKTRDAFMDHLIRELKTRHIPVAGSDRMFLADQLVIQDMVALARFTLLPGDDYNLACVLKGPLINLDDNDLLKLAPNRAGPLWQALNENAKSAPKFKKTIAALNALTGATPFDFFSKVLGPGRGREKFIQRLGHEVNDPLDEFLSLALEYEQNHTPSLQGFLKWFAAGKTQVKRDMERGKNEVRIMTIHGAKGLEAPIVYMPDTFKVCQKRSTDLLEIPPNVPNWGREKLLIWTRKKEMQVGPCKLAGEIFIAEEQAEHNRLMYVALTRAADRLYISGWSKKTDPKDPTWYGCIREMFAALDGVEAIDTGGEVPLLRLENPQTKDPEDREEKSADRIEAIPLKSWATAVAEKEAGPGDVVRPSRGVEDTGQIFGAGKKPGKAARNRGNIIHKLLEVLPDLPQEKWESVAKGYLAQSDKGLAPKDQQNIWNSVTQVLQHPDHSFIFGPGSQGEVSLVGTIDGDFVSAQIDRLVISKDHITIVDYKSNQFPPKTLAEVPGGYLHQIGIYRKLLKDRYPNKKIRAALLWTEDCSWMEISV